MCYDISQCHGAGTCTDIYLKGTDFGEGGVLYLASSANLIQLTPKIDAHEISGFFQ